MGDPDPEHGDLSDILGVRTVYNLHRTEHPEGGSPGPVARRPWPLEVDGMPAGQIPIAAVSDLSLSGQTTSCRTMTFDDPKGTWTALSASHCWTNGDLSSGPGF